MRARGILAPKKGQHTKQTMAWVWEGRYGMVREVMAGATVSVDVCSHTIKVKRVAPGNRGTSELQLPLLNLRQKTWAGNCPRTDSPPLILSLHRVQKQQGVLCIYSSWWEHIVFVSYIPAAGFRGCSCPRDITYAPCSPADQTIEARRSEVWGVRDEGFRRDSHTCPGTTESSVFRQALASGYK